MTVPGMLQMIACPYVLPFPQVLDLIDGSERCSMFSSALKTPQKESGCFLKTGRRGLTRVLESYEILR